MSTVPEVPTGPIADLSSVPPGTDWDYLDGDGMVLVSGDHHLIMPSGLHPKSIEQYIRDLLATQTQQDAALFTLEAVADPGVVRRIRREGVKKMDLNISQYMETALETTERRTIIRDLGSNIMGVFLDLVTEDETREHIRRADNVKAKLVISLDRRRPGITPEELAPVAEQIASDDEHESDIEIETVSGHRIRAGELILKKAVEVEAFAKTVHHQHAWELMDEYLRELRQSGMLDQ